MRHALPFRRFRIIGNSILFGIWSLHLGITGCAQQIPPSSSPPAELSPQQLDDLVAPVALFPDPLVAEVLAASTYPMEIAEAEQWLRDHPNWKPAKLMDKAKKQNWDPSVQGLVAFPAVLTKLTQNINWTTQLGNAFLAQQADVMAAVQRMRAAAQAKGTLRSTQQETVTTTNEGGQQEIGIEPANADVWYVPNYNPAYVWGPPVWGAYPSLLYPGLDVGFDWYPGIDLGLYFGGWGGWGWGGWGWMPNWYGGGIYTDGSFFHRYGFRHYGDGGLLGRSEWMHNPDHRLGVPYANPAVAGRFARQQQSFSRPEYPAQQRFGNPGFEQRGWTNNHSVFGGYHNGAMARIQSDRGFSSMGANRTFGGFGGATRGGEMRSGSFGGGMRGGGRR